MHRHDGTPADADALGARAALDFVAVNDLTDTKTLAHLFKYDSVLGSIPQEVKALEDSISVDGKKIKGFRETDPGKIPWKDLASPSWSNQPASSPTRRTAVSRLHASRRQPNMSPRKSAARRSLERLAGGPLTLGMALQATREGEGIGQAESF
jgi:hypothetical protein